MPSTSPCTLRSDSITGTKGVHSQDAAKGNSYNHNFQNRFCGCEEEYDADQEKGTMFQCLGLGTVETGGCGEDWWHPECLMGLPRNWQKPMKALADQSGAGNDERAAEAIGPDEDHPAPPGFPHEDDFEALLCYKCVESNPWIKQYASAPGFLPPLFKRDVLPASGNDEGSAKVEDDGTDKEVTMASSGSRKRKASEERDSRSSSPSKRMKEDLKPKSQRNSIQAETTEASKPKQKHDILAPAPKGTLSLFLKEDFRDNICHCPSCYPNLIPHPQLLEEEDIYEPPVSESGGSNGVPGSGAQSHGTGSLLERGEAALSTVDRVRAIEGVMVYNHLKDKVKDFLKPYAESGKAVGAEDIKAYFEKLRGDEAAIREAGSKPTTGDDDKENDGGTDQRREQSGY
jgi:E3 ubiquitin-protein ligase UBR7